MSLVEILVSVVLLGAAGVAVLGAMATAARGTSVNRSQADAIVWLQSTADYLANTPFVQCGAGFNVQDRYNQNTDQLAATAAPKPEGTTTQGTISVIGVQFWDSTSSSFSSTCTTSKLEQITLQVTNGSYQHSLVIVKSNV